MLFRSRWTGNNPLVRARLKGDTMNVVGQSTSLNADSLGGWILIDPTQSGQTLLGIGDSVRLSPRSAGTVKDRFGNAAENPTRWVPVAIGHRLPQLKVEFDKGALNYTNWPIDQGPSIKLLVKPGTTGSWQDFGTGSSVDPDLLRHGTGVSFTINHSLRGAAYLYDHQGVHVATMDLNPLLGAFATSKLPMDARNRYSVRILWNGTDDNGQMVASGIYTLRLLLWMDLSNPGEDADWHVYNRVYNLGWHVFTTW